MTQHIHIYVNHHYKMSHKSLPIPHYSMFNYLLHELLFINIDLSFVGLLNFKH